MSIEEDRIELKGTRREQLVARLKESGGGRLVCSPLDGRWEIQGHMPPPGWMVIDVLPNGRTQDYLVPEDSDKQHKSE